MQRLLDGAEIAQLGATAAMRESDLQRDMMRRRELMNEQASQQQQLKKMVSELKSEVAQGEQRERELLQDVRESKAELIRERKRVEEVNSKALDSARQELQEQLLQQQQRLEQEAAVTLSAREEEWKDEQAASLTEALQEATKLRRDLESSEHQSDALKERVRAVEQLRAEAERQVAAVQAQRRAEVDALRVDHEAAMLLHQKEQLVWEQERRRWEQTQREWKETKAKLVEHVETVAAELEAEREAAGEREAELETELELEREKFAAERAAASTALEAERRESHMRYSAAVSDDTALLQFARQARDDMTMQLAACVRDLEETRHQLAESKAREVHQEEREALGEEPSIRGMRFAREVEQEVCALKSEHGQELQTMAADAVASIVVGRVLAKVVLQAGVNAANKHAATRVAETSAEAIAAATVASAVNVAERDAIVASAQSVEVATEAAHSVILQGFQARGAVVGALPARLKSRWMASSLMTDYENELEAEVTLSSELQFKSLEAQLNADARLEDCMRAEARVHDAVMSSELAAFDALLKVLLEHDEVSEDPQSMGGRSYSHFSPPPISPRIVARRPLTLPNHVQTAPSLANEVATTQQEMILLERQSLRARVHALQAEVQRARCDCDEMRLRLAAAESRIRESASAVERVPAMAHELSAARATIAEQAAAAEQIRVKEAAMAHELATAQETLAEFKVSTMLQEQTMAAAVAEQAPTVATAAADAASGACEAERRRVAEVSELIERLRESERENLELEVKLEEAQARVDAQQSQIVQRQAAERAADAWNVEHLVNMEVLLSGRRMQEGLMSMRNDLDIENEEMRSRLQHATDGAAGLQEELRMVVSRLRATTVAVPDMTEFAGVCTGSAFKVVNRVLAAEVTGLEKQLASTADLAEARLASVEVEVQLRREASRSREQCSMLEETIQQQQQTYQAILATLEEDANISRNAGSASEMTLVRELTRLDSVVASQLPREQLIIDLQRLLETRALEAAAIEQVHSEQEERLKMTEEALRQAHEELDACDDGEALTASGSSATSGQVMGRGSKREVVQTPEAQRAIDQLKAELERATYMLQQHSDALAESRQELQRTQQRLMETEEERGGLQALLVDKGTEVQQLRSQLQQVSMHSKPHFTSQAPSGIPTRR